MIAGLRDFRIKDNLILLRILERIPGVENASRNVAIHNINTGQTSVIYRGDNGYTMPTVALDKSLLAPYLPEPVLPPPTGVIAYEVVMSNGKKDVFVINADGTGARNLSSITV